MFFVVDNYDTEVAGGYGRAYTGRQAKQLSGATLSLIPSSGIIDSDVKCGTDNRNFCNYPELPFVETLNIPQLLASANRLNRLPSGPCPDGYKKYPTKDCLNIAPAIIETSCCVYVSACISRHQYITHSKRPSRGPPSVKRTIFSKRQRDSKCSCTQLSP